MKRQSIVKSESDKGLMLGKKGNFRQPWVEGWSVRLREFNSITVTGECCGHLLLCLPRIDALFWNSTLMFSGNHAFFFLLCVIWEHPSDFLVTPWLGSCKSAVLGILLDSWQSVPLNNASFLLCHGACEGLGGTYLKMKGGWYLPELLV